MTHRALILLSSFAIASLRSLLRSSTCFAVLAVSLCLALHSSFAAEPKLDPQYPFRTDFANAHLPWYQLKPAEFPPGHSDHRVGGELVAADFIHRSGVFRMSGTGELVNFTLPPFGIVHYLNSPADLRDVPLGTGFLFFLHQDENGAFTKLATMQDDFTMTANHHANYRLDAVKLSEGKLIVTRQKLPAKEAEAKTSDWLVTGETRVWKGDQQVKLSGLAVGDELLANFTGGNAQHPRHCTDIWVGAETHQRVTEQQRAKHAAFLKERGLPAWITRAEGREITVRLLASEDPADRHYFGALIAAEFPMNKAVILAVANDELRTYNPTVDKIRARLVSIGHPGVEGYGDGGIEFVLQPGILLEGFRKGHIVRLFAEKWPAEDMPWGEGIGMSRVHASRDTQENIAREIPAQFPYRTDYGNAHLPWYRLQLGVVPPPYSAHVVTGELVKAGAAPRTGQFRSEITGALVDFTLTPEGATIVRTALPKSEGPVRVVESIASVLHLGAAATLADLPPGTRCRFHLYQDEKGAFTQASLVMDEYSYFALNHFTYRVEALLLDQDKLHVARQIPPALDYLGKPAPVPVLGRAILHVNDTTRIWKGARQVKLTDLAIGDELLVNLTGETATAQGRCTDIWIGADTHAQATEAQRKKHEERLKTEKTAQAK